MSLGCRLETTALAAIRSPLSVTTPIARPFSIRISFTAQFVRISTFRIDAGALNCLRNRPHAAHRMAPDALFAVHLAPAMVEKHIARAGGIGAVVGSNDSVEAEDRLDRIALEPLVEDIAGRAGEKLEEIALSFEVERTQAVSDFDGIDEGAEIGGEPLPRRHIGRRIQRERAQNVGDRSSRAS